MGRRVQRYLWLTSKYRFNLATYITDAEANITN